MLLRLFVVEYRTGWTVSLFCECATHAAELDSAAIRFRWCAAHSKAGRAAQRPSHLDHLRSLARPFAYAFSSHTLWTECSTLLTELLATVAWQRPSYLDHLRSLARPFACAFSSPTLWTECSTLLKEMLATVACFQQMTAPVPKSQYCQCRTFTKNMRGHFKCLFALSKLGLCVIRSLNKCPCGWQCPVKCSVVIVSWYLLRLSNAPVLLAKGLLNF